MISPRALLFSLFALLSSTALGGNLKVTIAPAAAVSAGAQWRVDGGAWRASGATVKNLSNATHTVEYKPIAGGWLAPSPASVTLTNNVTTTVTATYAAPASLAVALTPSGGQWRVDGGVWRNSGTTASALTPGAHSISYNSTVANHLPPPNETVTLVAGQTTSVSRSYVPAGQVSVTLTPGTAQWRVDGGLWRATATFSDLLAAGSHTLEYSPAAGYLTPASETITILAGQTLSLSKAYTAESSLTVNLSPWPAQFRVNGGAWQANGTRVGQLSAGTHSVEYAPLDGYGAPPAESVALGVAEQKTISRNYATLGSITVNVMPAAGQWRLNGGAWNASGATVRNLPTAQYTLELSPMEGLVAPPSEVFELSMGENKTLTRSYQGVSSVSVTLTSGVGQWRVDGGPWQTSGTVVYNYALGSHTLEYAPVDGYIAPPAETIWVRQNHALTLSRSYLNATGAYLHLKTIPAQLTENGIAKWRIDGGAWNAAGTAVAVPAGTYTLEFQPVAGLDVPPPSSVTVAAGTVETIEATFYMQHRLRFFLHSDLVAGMSTQDLHARLSQYAADLQTIWHRETLRRLSFDPSTDISIVTASPFSNQAVMPIPEYGFELWAYADKASGSNSHGGNVAIHSTGAGGANGMHWPAIYDPSLLAAGSTELREYCHQINTITHEFEHVFRAGFGEYYSASGFKDLTGVAPLYSVDYFAPADPFWNAHSNFWGDPLLRNALDNYRIGAPNTRAAVLEATRFSDASRGIINGLYRNKGTLFDNNPTLPDLSRVQVRVIDANTGEGIPGATLRMWQRPQPNLAPGVEEAVTPGSAAGQFEFDWMGSEPGSPLSNGANGKLFKAFAPGYQPKAQWDWIYDAQRLKTVEDVDVWEITIALDPIP